MSTNTLRRMAKYLVYLSFVTPLLVFPAHFVFPFVISKVVFFRSIMVLSGLLFLVILFYERKKEVLDKRNFFTPITIAVLCYFISLIISTIVSADWRFSLWNNQERMLGLFTIAHYGILFFVSRYLFKTWAEWKNVLGVLSTIGVIVIVVGVIQKFIPDFFYNRSAGQVVSTLGNPIYLSGFGLYLFFINVWAGFKSNNWQRWLFWLASFFGLIGIFITDTRGTSLGLIVGILVALIMYGILSNSKQIKKITAACLLVMIVSVGMAFAFKHTETIQKIPLVGKIVNISVFEGSAKTRLMAWQIALEGWKSKPLFGWGPTNYYPDFLKFGFQETWFDNAHNMLVNVLAEGGAFGLLSTLLLFGLSGYCLLKIYRGDHLQKPFFIIGSAFLVGHFVHVFFAFEDITSYLYFFLFLALVDVMYRTSRMVQDNEIAVDYGTKSVPLLVIIFSVLIAGIVIFASNVNVAITNNHSYHTRGLLTVSNKVDAAVARYKATKKWHSPYQGDIDWNFTSDVLTVLPDVYSQSTSTARGLYDLAYVGMKNYVSTHPLDVRGRLVYTDILRAGIVLFDLSLKDEINEQFRIAQELSPQRQQVKYSELSFMAGTGDLKKAIEIAEKLVEENPYDAEAYYNLARFLYHDGQMIEILSVLDKAINNGVRFFDPAHLEFVAMAYEREGRFRDALFWWDQMYQKTGNESVRYKRDELSGLTKKPVPKTLEEFFKFEKK